jgi:serine/threonine protein kinase
MLKLALAMQHVHQRGILHRDLKPSNVLMMADDIPKITDFGLAKFTPQHDAEMMTISIPRDFTGLVNAGGPDTTPSDENAQSDLTTTFDEEAFLSEWGKKLGTPSIQDEQRLDEIRQFIQEALHQGSLDLSGELQILAELTKSRAIMGTPQYMAPEQASGRIEEVGPAADIYSLGAVMYEMLTGRPPFTGQTMQVISDVLSKPPVPPRQRRDSINPGLEAICMKCLEKRIERRYETMGQLAEDLQRFIDGSVVSAITESSPPSQRFDDAKDAVGGPTTRTLVPNRTTVAISTKSKSWWQFWR